MALNLATLPTETLLLILRPFCLHCSKEHDYDSSEGYFRSRAAHEQQADQASWWYSRDCQQTLHSMCLVSKRLTPVAQSVLHHDFIPGYGDGWRSTRFSWDGRLTSFLRTIALRPDLADGVKRIFVHPYLLRAVSEEEAQATLEEVVRAARPESGIQLSEYHSSFEDLRRQYPDPTTLNLGGWKLVGMLLALVPNLERFSLQVSEPGGIPAAAFAALRGVSGSGTVLSKLKTLDICSRSDGSWLFRLDQYADGILEAVAAGKGNLSTLNLHMCGGTGLVNLQGLETLRLTCGRLGEGCLARLLDSCRTPGLRSFSYEATGPMTSDWDCFEDLSGDDHFQPSAAIQHLVPHAQTLTSLHLDLRFRGLDESAPRAGWFDIQALSETQPQTTLSCFTALKHLFLNASAVCNTPSKAGYTTDDEDRQLLTSLLPPNIESLYLGGGVRDGVGARMANALLYLARAVRGGEQFKGLKTVRCDEELEGSGVLTGYGVAQAFEFAGVDFGFERCEVSEPTLRWGEGTPEPEIGSEDEGWGRVYIPVDDYDDDDFQGQFGGPIAEGFGLETPNR